MGKIILKCVYVKQLTNCRQHMKCWKYEMSTL